MTPIGRAWTGAQWAGEHTLDAPSLQPRIPSAERRDPSPAPWNLSQWAGDPARQPLHPWIPPIEPDASGGLSGFGVPDSGGCRWATADGFVAHRGDPATGPTPTNGRAPRAGARAA